MNGNPRGTGITLRGARRHAAGILAVLAIARAAAAEPAPPADAAAKERARQLFDAGNARLSSGETEAALSAFLESRATYPTRGNTLNAALLLHRLGRHDEALELYLALARDFTLPAADKAQVEREVAMLQELTGRLEVTADAGATIEVDGRSRGSAPAPEPFIVLSGKRTVRVTAPGRAPFETAVVVHAGQTAKLVVRLEAESSVPAALPPLTSAPPAAPQQPPSPPAPPADDGAGVLLGVAVGPAIGAGFGGPLADSCAGGCSTRLPFGVLGTLRAGYRFWSRWEVAVELGWSRLSGRYDDRADLLEPVGAGPQSGVATDSLTWSGTLVGARGGWSRGERLLFRLGLGAGVALVSASDQRRGRYDVNPPAGDPYEARVLDERSSRGSYLYLAPEIGVGFRLADAVELSADLGLFTLLGLSTPRYDNPEGVVVRDDAGNAELAALRTEELTGSAFFVVVPRLALTFRP